MSDQSFRFSVDILLSEPAEWQLDEIVSQTNSAYPANTIVKVISPEDVIRTDRNVLAAFNPVDAENGKMITLISAGFPDEAFRSADHQELAWHSADFGEGALAAISDHRSYLNVSITPADDSLAARFRAARQLTSFVAVLASQPQTLGILCLWANRMSAPDKWTQAAEQAAEGNWPLFEWLSFRSGWDMNRQPQNTYSLGYTTGLSAFLGYEMHMEAAPMKPTEVLQMLFGACYLPLQGGNLFRDGDTIGMEGGLSYRLRQRKAADGSPAPIMVLLHPSSPIDEIAEFGPNPLQPAPDGQRRDVRPKPGFMKRLLGRN